MFYPQSARRAIVIFIADFGRLGRHDIVVVKSFVAPRTCKGELRLLERRAAISGNVSIFNFGTKM